MDILTNMDLLTILWMTPLVTGLVLLFSKSLHLTKIITLISSSMTFFLTLLIWTLFKTNHAGIQFGYYQPWIKEMGISYFIGIDGISLPLIILTSFLMLLVVISIWNHKKLQSFFALFCLLHASILGALVSLDFVIFYIFWEIMLIPMYFLIGYFGGTNRRYATTKFMIYTVFGSLMMLISALILYEVHYEQFGFYSTNLLNLYQVKIPEEMQNWLFFGFVIAFAIKIPLWPFHTWLPDAHTEAPTSGSVILAGVLLKLGLYGIVRFVVPLFPQAFSNYATFILALAVIGILYGAIVAWVQKDAKRMIAYSSVSHLGFMVLGIFALLPSKAISQIALEGAWFQLISHALSTGALFFLIGVLYERRHTRLIASYGGIAQKMPWFAVMFFIATMTSIGLPGTSGFVGEFLILLGLFKTQPYFAVVASFGILFSAVYMLRLYKEIFFGSQNKPENANLADLKINEWLYLTPLVLLMILFGLFPELVMEKSRASLEYLSLHFKDYQLTIHAGDVQNTQTSIAKMVYP